MKYLLLMEDKPTESYSGLLQYLRYSKREEYLTMEYWEVPSLEEIDITKKPKPEVYEVSVNKEELIKIRDFLNSLNLEDD